MKYLSNVLAAAIAAAVVALAACSTLHPPADTDWPVYGGQPSQNHYSRLRQITPANVSQLREAWRFTMKESGDSQTNPLIVGRTVYAYTPDLKVIALDGVTGKLLWQFDAGLRGTRLGNGARFTGPARGLAFWSDGKERRLLAGVMNYLYELDPETGQPLNGFGPNGAIDLRDSLPGDQAQKYVSLTTPGTIYKDLIVVGFRTTESPPAPPGDIRAFDVRTGKLRWTFHTIPRGGEYGEETWPKDAWRDSGAANNWAGFALDQQRGILFAPLGSAVPDMYGADRLGNDLFADSLVALDAATGKRLWHFQGVHHDIWDRDFPAPPSLVVVHRNGKRIDAVAQATKQGFLYVFDRVTGVPLFPIEEVEVAASDVPGEVASATQPRPTLPEPYSRQVLTESMLTNRTPEAHDWAVAKYRSLRHGPQFTPFTVDTPTILMPGFDGGAEWGGIAADAEKGIVYINANDIAWTGALVASKAGAGLSGALYQSKCMSCHGPQRLGSPPAFPSLVDATKRLTAQEMMSVIHNGRGRMPPFPDIQAFYLAELVDYVRTGKDDAASTDERGPGGPGERTPDGAGSKREMEGSLFSDGKAVRYRFTGYNKFLDPDGYPAVVPPWGTLNAIDLNTGKYLWRIPLGYYPELQNARPGIPPTGSENYGGPVLTASGLLFIGATIYDQQFRAFDAATGRLLWEQRLPFAGAATPATYMIDGNQYVLIATNNQRNPKGEQGAAYVAYALPSETSR